MASTRVLVDTSVIVAWIGEDPRFKVHLKKVLGDLRRKRASKFISVVTVQELEVGARYEGGDALEKLRAFLGAHFAPPLILDHATAKLAAQLAAGTNRRAGASSSERRHFTNVWHRDASIAAIAQHHALDAIVTANMKDFAPFAEHLDCRLIPVSEA
jgi:predicted nucleic acid-binding protein